MGHIIINSGWVPCIPLPCWCRQLCPTGSSTTTSQAASCCSLWCVSWPPYYEAKGCYMGSNILAEHNANTTASVIIQAHTATSKMHMKLHNTPLVLHLSLWGTRWRSWLRHCSTSRKVAGSIPHGVIKIFQWLNPPGRTMALGSTLPLTEMSTRNLSWGVKAAGAYGWQPYHLQVPTV
jgi:hypothetical protein